MGNPSFLCFVPSSSATTPIDWSKVPEASKKFLLDGWGTDWSDPDTTKKRPLPATIDDLAKMLHESKFFGYMGPELCTLLLDISEFGLAKLRPAQTSGLTVGPRFYMKYMSQVWFVLFQPRERDGIIGYSPNLQVMEDEDAEITRDKALAEDFDLRLYEEVRRMGLVGAAALKRVAGWEACTLASNLKTAQMSEEIMALPTDHPAHRALMQSVITSLTQ